MVTDQWGRVKSTKTDPNTCVLVTCDNDVEVILMETFSEWCCYDWIFKVKITNTSLNVIPYIKHNSKWIV